MATSFDVICNRALSVIDDYKLRKLYDANIALFHDKVDGWVISSASKFIECEQPLTYDSELRQFDADLTDLEIQILAEYWVIYWWRGETDVATQIAQKLKVPSSFQILSISFTLYSTPSFFIQSSISAELLHNSIHSSSF